MVCKSTVLLASIVPGAVFEKRNLKRKVIALTPTTVTYEQLVGTWHAPEGKQITMGKDSFLRWVMYDKPQVNRKKRPAA
jgi:hypothetical protein